MIFVCNFVIYEHCFSYIFCFLELPVNVISFSELISDHTPYLSLAREWGVFVYPTDTIYGVWWIVNKDVVTKIDAIKHRLPGKYYSSIIPSFERVERYCDVWDDFESTRNNLKSQYCVCSDWSMRGLTVLVPVRDADNNSMNEWEEDRIDFTLLSPSWKIWVRYIDHPFQEFVTALWVPFITTSINISGQPSITSLDFLQDDQCKLIDIALDAWILAWEWSVVVDLESTKIVRA